MIYIGIDPGKAGSLAIINGDDVEIIPFDEEKYIKTLEKYALYRKACVLEHVSAMPGQGVTSMFNFGANFGWIQGVLQALSVPYELVRPRKWKKEFSITGDKNSSIAVCKRLFPDVSLLPTERCRKDNDGMAEALLMAEFARRKL
jgi:crossover junction endodeoxyribonuclease RuvC